MRSHKGEDALPQATRKAMAAEGRQSPGMLIR
jgi:hypothetical protein